MGSVNLIKYGPDALLAPGLNCHYEKELRMSESIEHANKDIRRELTHLNYDLSFGKEGGIERDAMTWSQAKRVVQERVDKIDGEIPPKRIRSDRKTWYMLEIHCPKEIERAGREDEFFEAMFEALNECMDGTLIWGQIHKDEVHEYHDYLGKDASGKAQYELKESQHHMDVIGVPFDPEKGVNMKSFMNPQRLQTTQERVHKRVLDQFGVDMWTYKGHSDTTIAMYKEQEAEIRKTRELTMQREAKELELSSLSEQAVSLKEEAEKIRSDAYEEVESLSHAIEEGRYGSFTQKESVIGYSKKVEKTYYEVPEDDLRRLLGIAQMSKELQEEKAQQLKTADEIEKEWDDFFRHKSDFDAERRSFEKEKLDFESGRVERAKSDLDVLASVADPTGEMTSKLSEFEASPEYEKLRELYTLSAKVDRCEPYDVPEMVRDHGVDGALKLVREDLDRQEGVTRKVDHDMTIGF